MHTFAFVLAIAVTALYGYGAQATMAADLARTRVAVAAASVERPEPIWYGGTLAPMVVEGRLDGPALVAQPAPACGPERRRG